MRSSLVHVNSRVLLSFGVLFACWAGVWPVIAAEPTMSSGSTSAKRPNVIFILADDWGWGDLGCYGHKILKTPNLDRLAKGGTLFTNFYVGGSVCSPSRAAFMTGQYPARNRVHGHFATPELNAKRGMPNFLDPAVPTVTKLLHDAGYVTGHFGKWHLGRFEEAPSQSAYGIDDYRCVGADKAHDFNMKEPQFRAKLTGHIVDESIRFIEANRDKPFFMQTWLLDVHAVLDPTEEQMKLYARFGPKGANHKGALQVYYGAATAADKELGRLLAKLDELGLKNNTIVVFSSDNGPEDIHLGEASHSGVGSTGPFRGRKRSLYEGGIRLPFIVRWPVVTPGGKVDNTSIIGGVDFLPTICSLAGVPLKLDMKLDGLDMSDAFRGKPMQRSKPLQWEWRFNVLGDPINKCPILAIRDGNWKLLMNPDRSRVELYDIPKDPSEVDNLAQQNPQVVERLAKVVLDWQKTLPPGPFDSGAGSNEYPWPQ